MKNNTELEKLFLETLDRVYDGDLSDQELADAITKAYILGTRDTKEK